MTGSKTSGRWAWGLGGLLAGVALAAAGGWWFMAGAPLTQSRPDDGAARSVRPTQDTIGGDAYLSQAVTLVVREDTDVVDFPSQSGGAMVRQLTRGASVTGRWVQGADANSRWLRLVDGGYVYSASLARPVRAAPPIRIAISNQNCQWGDDLQPYFDRSIAAREALAARSSDGIAPEDSSSFITVPNRSWNGLTVTAVAVHWESAAVYFREPVAEVRRVLRANNIEVRDTGEMPIRNEEAVEAQSLDATNPEDRRYGASSITCGI